LLIKRNLLKQPHLLVHPSLNTHTLAKRVKVVAKMNEAVGVDEVERTGQFNYNQNFLMALWENEILEAWEDMAVLEVVVGELEQEVEEVQREVKMILFHSK